jgi:hypothetical protein
VTLGSFSVRHILENPGETAADITRTIQEHRVQEHTYRENKMPSAFVTSPIPKVSQVRRPTVTMTVAGQVFLFTGTQSSLCVNSWGDKGKNRGSPVHPVLYSSADFP